MRDTGYRILADGVTVSNDTWATGIANNDLIIGPTGGGKTRGYVLPNLLSSTESFIVTDGKGTLRRQVGGILCMDAQFFQRPDFLFYFLTAVQRIYIRILFLKITVDIGA